MSVGTLGIQDKATLSMLVGDYQADLLGRSRKFYIIESLNKFVPEGHLIFADREGLLIDNLDVLMSQLIRFRLGHPKTFGSENVFEHRHRLFSIRDSDQFSPNDSGSLTFDMVTWGEYGRQLTGSDYVGSYGELSASDTFKKLCADRGYKVGTVEPSVDKKTYIQAQWTDAQFIRHLADNAVSSYGTRGFLYFSSRTGEIHFASAKYLYEQGKGSAVSMIYGGSPEAVESDLTIQAWMFSANGQVLLSSLGTSQNFKRFDVEAFQYLETTKQMNFSELSSSDYSLMRSDEATVSRSIDLGRNDSNFKQDSRNVSGLLTLQVLLKWTDLVIPGSVVSVVIPVNDYPGAPSRIILDTLSSKWIVSKVIHYLDAVSNDYVMKLVLSRSGVSSKGASGLIS